MIQLDYNDPQKLQWAVSESLLNYARMAALGTSAAVRKIDTRHIYSSRRSKIYR